MHEDPWATYDHTTGTEFATLTEKTAGKLAFYGRCSTEDNQEPETSRGWQLGNARKFVEPMGGTVVAQFFDIGQSRSVPWDRRPHASRLLTALKDPGRKWGGLVVGEGTRCWFGAQFSMVAPRLAAYDVDLWVPELGGRFDARNPSHKMLMNVLGGMSESERQHVQARVRAAMDAQVLNEGRHQGGRAPYGYVVVDGGPHPNPVKAAAGARLRLLTIDTPAAEVVRRIFRESLDAKGHGAIASGLNRDKVPCPSARRPEQNRHRRGDGWQASTVRAILENPRYTGYAVFGRWTRQEVLLDPDDVAAGHVVRFRRSTPSKVVRSRQPAHPQIVSVQAFTQAHLLRRSRTGDRPRLERHRETVIHAYRLRGLVRCGICGRKMYGAVSAGRPTYYRCVARTLAPDMAVRLDHPRVLSLREDAILSQLNAWLIGLFTPPHLERTTKTLAQVKDHADNIAGRRQQLEQLLADAQIRLRRLRRAIEAGAEPSALAEAINLAHEQRTAAQAELAQTPRTTCVTSDDEVRILIQSIDDLGKALQQTKPSTLQRLYEALRIELTYRPHTKTIDVSACRRRTCGER